MAPRLCESHLDPAGIVGEQPPLPVRHRTAAPGVQHPDPCRARAAQREGEHLGRPGVDPLRVVQGDEQPAALRELAERPEQAEPDRVRSSRLVARVGAQQGHLERAALRSWQGREVGQ